MSPPPASPPAARESSRSPAPPASRAEEDESTPLSQGEDKGEGSEEGETSEAREPAPSKPTNSDHHAPHAVSDESTTDGPPLPKEPIPENAPPLPQEAPPEPEDDGWDCLWDPTSQNWFFSNRFTGKTQWENPRVPTSTTAAVPVAPGTEPNGFPTSAATEKPVAGGYNPAIHGDYDPNAWYAQGYNNAEEQEEEAAAAAAAASAAAAANLAAGGSIDPYASTAQFNRFTGQFQTDGTERHSDEAKSRRQMNAFFDVDAAANAHDGRSLKAERSNKKPSKAELKAFKEKRRARKEEKRRAWLRD
ncbi:WW domain-containing protein-like protein [Hapsidospora chrysogenum ATCC 11550]|uniref:WW domain-containing protein-like protein n=1 Tax=Hapsidospora chrysogenum (strain ATCC 11550 / CBS 779.69 / DSM 880 / IAM 14645 / JCM 23072 / IMI 49137) TaxID=857340 RepID=A0A086THJ9_HAPC1|nr:WW domain-containing protein-like protein [Hapsidospora chrysogenum ATCC 11550]